MTGNQVWQSIIDKANIYWNEVFEHDIEGEEFINFLKETGDRNQWGGANKIAIFAKMETLKVTSTVMEYHVRATSLIAMRNKIITQ
eukprot:15472211-Heterocapsa_arctica.AAC.1